jgi:hypothetical protein
MKEQSIIPNARKYANDVKSAGNEKGDKDTEIWGLSLVSRSEKSTLEKKYRLTVVIELIPDVIRAFITEVTAAMTRAGATFTRTGNLDFKTGELQYLVAYSNKRGK